MFRRSSDNPPGDIAFPSELAALGIKRDELGQYVKIDAPNEFIKFKVHEDEEVNTQLAQAVNRAIHQDVLTELARLGLQPHYLYQERGAAQHSSSKPAAPNVTILTSDVQELTEKERVFIIIGDSSQELGIFSFKTTKTAGGIDKGTAVGLVKELQSMAVERKDELPGIVILNPGELLWSYEFQKCLSNRAWINRPRPNALYDTFAITSYNRVYGHKDAQEHIASFFDKFAMRLFSSLAQVHVAALGDGSDAALAHLNDIISKSRNPTIIRQFKSMALLESTHEFHAIVAPVLKDFLRENARAWVASQEPKGTLLKHAEEAVESGSNSVYTDFAPGSPSTDPPKPSFDELMKTHNREGYDKVQRELEEEAVALPMPPKPRNRSGSKKEFKFPITGSKAAAVIEEVVRAHPATVFNPPTTGSRAVAAVEEVMRAPYMTHRRTREVFDPLETTGPVPCLEDDIREKVEDDDEGDADKDDADKDEAVNESDKNDNDKADANKDDAEPAGDPLEPYPYIEEPANCVTFSAGVEDVPEMVFPAVMDDVVSFFEWKLT